jgi:guanylate kinase
VSEGRARPLVLAAPSGTGKTTIARRLVEDEGDFVFSVSATTRAPRPGERDGVDYDFLDRAAFEALVDRGELVEWAEVHGRHYGTPRRNVDRAARDGRHVVLDIDVQGAAQIRARVPDALLVFVLPPSIEALVARLGHRATEDRGEMARRLSTALDELDQVDAFDHVIVNDDLDQTVGRIREAVRGGGDLARPDEMKQEVARLREEVAETLRSRFARVATVVPRNETT